MPWTAEDIPDQSGRTVVVTGATSGLGLETARALARHGAHVVLAARNPAKADDVMATIRAETPDAKPEHLPLDLADLASVKAAATAFSDTHGRLDVLIDNAGVMATPKRRTADGFELQFGTNHLGHFAFTGLVLPTLLATPGARVVTVSSLMHRMGRMHFDDLNWERSYSKWGAYGQSKLANLLFTFELQRRLETAGADASAVAAHPGYSATHLQYAGPEMERGFVRTMLLAGNRLMNTVVAQDAAHGALPILFAATAPGVSGASYWGPDGLGERRGHPAPATVSRQAKNVADARRLWDASVELTGVDYGLRDAG